MVSVTTFILFVLIVMALLGVQRCFLA